MFAILYSRYAAELNTYIINNIHFNRTKHNIPEETNSWVVNLISSMVQPKRLDNKLFEIGDAAIETFL